MGLGIQGLRLGCGLSGLQEHAGGSPDLAQCEGLVKRAKKLGVLVHDCLDPKLGGALGLGHGPGASPLHGVGVLVVRSAARRSRHEKRALAANVMATALLVTA